MSFFDDIENDINDNSVVDTNTVTKLYGITHFTECETPDDFINFIMEMTKLPYLIESILVKIRSNSGIIASSIYYDLTKITKIKEFQSYNYRCKAGSINPHTIIFTPKNEKCPEISISVNASNFQPYYSIYMRIYAYGTETYYPTFSTKDNLIKYINLPHYYNKLIEIRNILRK